MNLIQKYRPSGIAVTDLTAQLWCEKQLEFSLKHGRKKTQEMQKGKDRHQDLHEEITVLVPVKLKSIEDHIALRLHNCLVGLTRLLKKGMTRETPIWGKVNSLFTVGVIDELVLKQDKLIIIDTKTRTSDKMPSEAQKRTTQFQLMLYKYLFDSINESKFTTEDLLQFYGFNEKNKITQEFQKQIDDLGNKIEPNILKLSNNLFSLIKKLPKIDPNLKIRYENQHSKKLIGVDNFKFELSELKRNCDFVEEFWLGKREAIPVGETNKWKCNYCEFNQICQSNIKT